MLYLVSHMVGDDDGEVPPVPIPNTELEMLSDEIIEIYEGRIVAGEKE